MGILRDDVDRAIWEALNSLETSLSIDDPIAAEMWRGQIQININRFPDLKQKWLGDRRFANLMIGEATVL
jgi:hypothetical protein